MRDPDRVRQELASQWIESAQQDLRLTELALTGRGQGPDTKRHPLGREGASSCRGLLRSMNRSYDLPHPCPPEENKKEGGGQAGVLGGLVTSRPVHQRRGLRIADNSRRCVYVGWTFTGAPKMRPLPSFVDHPAIRTSPRMPGWLTALLVFEIVVRLIFLSAFLITAILLTYLTVGIFLLILF